MLTLIRLSACYVLALVLTLLLLGVLMFTQQFAVIDGWLLSGQPLTQLLLLLPASAVADLPIIVELFRRIVFNAAASGSRLFFVASTMSSS